MKPKNCIYPDCLNCTYSDCRYNELEYSDIVQQNAYDKELEIVNPEVQLKRRRDERYEKTDKAKLRRKKYEQSDKAKIRRKRYEQSDKAKERWKRYYRKKKLQKEVAMNEQSKSKEIQGATATIN